MKIHKTRGQLCCPKPNYTLWKVAFSVKMIYHGLISATRTRWISGLTFKITTEHEIKNEETIIVILESIAKVYQEGVVDLQRGEKMDEAYTVEWCRTSSSNRLSWMIPVTAPYLTHFFLSTPLSA
jgi:hypothetical protein